MTWAGPTWAATAPICTKRRTSTAWPAKEYDSPTPMRCRVCSPTRATLITGKHAARLRITIWAEGSLDGPQRSEAASGRVAARLAPHRDDAGQILAVGRLYDRAGRQVAPGGCRSLSRNARLRRQHRRHTLGGAETFFWPYRGVGRFGSEFRYVPHLEFGQPGEYLTDRLTDEAISVIDRAGEKPFFLCLTHHAVHTPIEAKAADIQHFKGKRSAELQSPARRLCRHGEKPRRQRGSRPRSPEAPRTRSKHARHFHQRQRRLHRSGKVERPGRSGHQQRSASLGQRLALRRGHSRAAVGPPAWSDAGGRGLHTNRWF